MKIRRPQDATPNANAGPRPPAYSRAQEAAIEKAKTPYIALKCEHFTDWDEVEVYSVFAPRKDLYWCEKCGKWRTRLQRKRPVALPDEPLF